MYGKIMPKCRFIALDHQSYWQCIACLKQHLHNTLLFIHHFINIYSHLFRVILTCHMSTFNISFALNRLSASPTTPFIRTSYQTIHLYIISCHSFVHHRTTITPFSLAWPGTPTALRSARPPTGQRRRWVRWGTQQRGPDTLLAPLAAGRETAAAGTRPLEHRTDAQARTRGGTAVAQPGEEQVLRLLALYKIFILYYDWVLWGTECSRVSKCLEKA